LDPGYPLRQRDDEARLPPLAGQSCRSSDDPVPVPASWGVMGSENNGTKNGGKRSVPAGPSRHDRPLEPPHPPPFRGPQNSPETAENPDSRSKPPGVASKNTVGPGL